MRCLRDSFEGKYEQLNVNMNFFVLLKNELQIPYLSASEPEIVNLRKAMSKYPILDEEDTVSDEIHEYKILEKILNNQPLDIDEHQEEMKNVDTGLKHSTTLSKQSKEEEEREAKKQVLLGRILNKLTQYNERIN